MGKLREEEVEGAMDEDEEIMDEDEEIMDGDEEIMNEDEEITISALLLLLQAPPKRVVKLTPQDEEAALIMLRLSQGKSHQLKEVKTVKKQVKKDDSPQTLNLLRDWINNTAPKNPPQEIIDIVGVCSKPIRKQLTVADVKIDQTRLRLKKEQVKKMMLDVMKKSDALSKNGLEVSVYGKDKKKAGQHEMRFTKWTKDTPVLTGKGWTKFVKDYGLKEHSDFVSVWMFRHKHTDQICFAIECTRFDGISLRLSQRILNKVFNE